MYKVNNVKKNLEKQCVELLESVHRWKKIGECGCSDPFWPDGINMNLVRNHIIYYKRTIYDICSENNFTIPDAYYTPTPPEVSRYYMANLNQKERVQRLTQMGNRFVTEKPFYDDSQMSLI